MRLQEANLEQAEKDKERAETFRKRTLSQGKGTKRLVTAYKVAVAQVKSAAED